MADGTIKIDTKIDDSSLKGQFNKLKLSLSALALGAIAAVGKGFYEATKSAIEFEKQMNNVATLLDGDVNKRVDELSGSILELSRNANLDTSTLTSGLYDVVSALGDSAESMEVLEIAAKGAKAGNAEVSDSVNLLSAVMKGYGDTSLQAAKKASDLAFQTVKLGQTTFPELASSLGKVIPLASSLKVSEEQLFGAMATLTGVTGNTSEVTTQLKAVMQSILKPTEDAAKAFKDVGYETAASALEAEGIDGVLRILKDSVNGNNAEFASLFSSVEASTAALALAGSQAENFTKKTNEMTLAVGATDAAFQKQNEGLGSALSQSGNNFKTFGIMIGSVFTPIIESAVRGLNKLDQVLIFDNMKKATSEVETFNERAEETGIISEKLSMKEGALAKKRKEYAEQKSKDESKALEDYQAQIQAINELRDAENERISGVIDAQKSASTAYKAEITAIKTKEKLALISKEESIQMRIDAEKDYQSELIKIGYDGLINEAGKLDEGDKLLLSSIERRKEMESLFTADTADENNKRADDYIAMLDRQENAFVDYTATQKQSFSEMFKAFSGDVAAVAKIAYEALNTIVNFDPALVKEELDKLTGTLTKFFTDTIQNAPEIIKSGIDTLKNFLKSMSENKTVIKENITKMIVSIVDMVLDNLPMIISLGAELAITLFRGIIKALPQVVKSLVEAMPEIVNTLVQEFFNVGGWLINGILDGFLNGARELFAGVGNVIDDFVGFVKDNLGIASPSKVFAEIGGFTAAGIGVGFDKSFTGVVKNIGDKMKELGNSASIDANIGVTAAAVSNVSKTFDVRSNIPETIGFSGGEIAHTYPDGIKLIIGGREFDGYLQSGLNRGMYKIPRGVVQ